VLAFVFVVSCGDEEHTVSNQGSLCVGRSASQAGGICPQFSLEQQLSVHVDFGICMSGSCDRAGETSCRTSRSGSIIEVTAEGSWFHADTDGCTFDCRHLTATCQTDPLPDGDYVIRYAGQSLAVTIPSSRSRNCTGGGFSGCCDTTADCAAGSTCDSSNMCKVPAQQ
jgi:hypothetical protein